MADEPDVCAAFAGWNSCVGWLRQRRDAIAADLYPQACPNTGSGIHPNSCPELHTSGTGG